ncbi:hypothetical protein RCL1_000301 [Eukaryota sp. TZLM3-RCL]
MSKTFVYKLTDSVIDAPNSESSTGLQLDSKTQSLTLPEPSSSTSDTRKRRSTSSTKPRKKTAISEEVLPLRGPLQLSGTLLTHIARYMTVTNLFWTTDDLLELIESWHNVPSLTLQYMLIQILKTVSEQANTSNRSIKSFLRTHATSKVAAYIATRDYGIPKKQMDNLRETSGDHKFDLRVIRKLAREVHISYVRFKLKRERRSQKRAENALLRPAISIRRRERLAAEFEKFGLQLPEQCATCNRYIDSGRGKPTEIAQDAYAKSLRQAELIAELAKYNLKIPSLDQRCNHFIERGEGSAVEIASDLNQVEVRKRLVREELEKFGLDNSNCQFKFNSFIAQGIGDAHEIASSIHKEIVDKQQRRETLVNELGKHGLRLRSDSRLCDAFIHQGIGDPVKIAEIMSEMNFYHTQTSYSSYYQRHKYREKRRDGYYDHESVGASAKDDAINEWCRKFDSAEEAVSDSRVPQTLYEKIRSAFPLRSFVWNDEDDGYSSY